jgi:hypothetical protein
MTEDTEIHIDELAYAVALLDGAKRIHSSSPAGIASSIQTEARVGARSNLIFAADG